MRKIEKPTLQRPEPGRFYRLLGTCRVMGLPEDVDDEMEASYEVETDYVFELSELAGRRREHSSDLRDRFVLWYDPPPPSEAGDGDK